MGGSSSKQDIVAKLEELDKKELDLNLKLKDMQVELNGMLPKNEQIKVNQSLTANSKIKHYYTAAAHLTKSVGAKPKKNGKSEKSKGKGKGKKGKGDKDKKKKK